MLAKKLGMDGIILPLQSALIASVVKDISVYGVDSLTQTFDYLSGKISLTPLPNSDLGQIDSSHLSQILDFSDVKGQEKIRRAVESL